MPKNYVRVIGIRSYAFHGCLKEETQIGGDFETDVVMQCDFEESAQTDDLTKTINYVDVNRIVVEEMAIRADLIETVGRRIVNRLKQEIPMIEKVEVTIHKINPPLNGDVKEVSITIKDRNR